MAAVLDPTVEQDIARIRAGIAQMGALARRAVSQGLMALRQRDPQAAYAVIIRDQRIDELEKQIDQWCLDFLLRHQPAGQLLRLAYSALKVNAELERVGDYAESIARQSLKLMGMEVGLPLERFEPIGKLSVQMLRDAVQAFVDQDAELASKAMAIEPTVDDLKSTLNKELVSLFRQDKLPWEAVNACLMIARRLERVSDQAKNICLEAIYVATGQQLKHPTAGVFRVLFVDQDHGPLSRMAEAIGTALGRSEWVFSSAGLAPRPLDERAARFMAQKGLPPGQPPKKPDQIPNLDFYQIVVCLRPGLCSQLQLPPAKRVELEWEVPDPSRCGGSEAELQAAYEAAYQRLQREIQDLIQAVLGVEMHLMSSQSQ